MEVNGELQARSLYLWGRTPLSIRHECRPQRLCGLGCEGKTPTLARIWTLVIQATDSVFSD